MDYIISEIIKTMKTIHSESLKLKKFARLNDDAASKGVSLSKQVCAQQEYVFPTPLMKNALIIHGDIVKDGDHYTKLKAGTKSKAVAWMNDVVNACLKKYNDSGSHERYDWNEPPLSVKHYDTDCWLGWKPEIWDIQLGQAKQRADTFKEYTNPKTTFGMDQMIKLLSTDLALQKAVKIEMEIWPETKASREISDINNDWASKKSGVSYPDFRNDATLVEGTDMTYGEYEIKLAREALSQGLTKAIQFGVENNVYTGYPRNQRGKGRALEAQSRRTNLIVNMINGPEMENWKTLPFFGTGLQDVEAIRNALNEMAEFVIDHPEYTVLNKDYTSWDKNVGYGWILLSNAIRYLRTPDTWSRQLICLRNLCEYTAYFLDGPNDRVSRIWGRMMSGFIDTTLGNTTVNRLVSRYSVFSSDPKYSSNVTYPSKKHDLITLGDDLVLILLKSTIAEKKFVSGARRVGQTAHADQKDAYGPMFLQYRLFESDGKRILSYNWPRVWRSMLSKEESKGLGPAGWTLSFYQQIDKCAEYKPSLYILSNLAYSLDTEHLMLDKSVEHIKKLVQEEDRKSLQIDANGMTNKQRRAKTTAEKLNYNPQMRGVNSKGEMDWDFFERVQKSIKESIDPDFWSKIGMTPPDLSLIKRE